MKKEVVKVIHVAPATGAALSDLDQLIGERRAFSRIADSCSAADAKCMRRIRDEKLFAAKGVSWEEFCRKYLEISKPEANRIIRRFEEFGESYFDVSRIVRISPESYRAIAPAVKDKAIEWNGERISLTPENSQRVHAAVQALRQASEAKRPEKPAPPVDPVYERLNTIDSQITTLVKELLEICLSSHNGRDRQRIQSMAHYLKYSMLDLEVKAS